MPKVEAMTVRGPAVMLAMCRSLRFEVKSDPVEHGICNVRLTLKPLVDAFSNADKSAQT